MYWYNRQSAGGKRERCRDECRMCELQLTLIQNHEQCLQEVCSEFMTIASELHSDIIAVRESLNFAHTELSQIKTTCSVHTLTEIAETTERLNNIQQTVNGLDAQVDYLDNQSRRNNLRVDGVAETNGENWDITEAKCQSLFQELGLHSI